MAKTSSIQKNLKRKRLVEKFESQRLELKKIIKDKTLTQQERFDATLKLAALPRNSSKTRVRNRCEATGRPRGYIGKFRMSRIEVRALASIGQLPGVVKASW